MFELKNFRSIKIKMASPEAIRSWSSGEVKKSETINYRSLKPEKDGLFCDRIFGPIRSWECSCGKYKKVRYKGVICDKCGVEVTTSDTRRERMGHIDLAAPVTHIWYLKGTPSRISLALDMNIKDLESVVYFVNFIVTDPGQLPIKYKDVITYAQRDELEEQYGEDSFKVSMGAEAVKQLLSQIDLEKESKEMYQEIERYKNMEPRADGKKTQIPKKLLERYDLLESFRQNGTRPEWMVLDVIPVLPPEIRPLVPLDGGRYASSDLNELYKRVIYKNNTLRTFIDKGHTPDIMLKNQKRILQEAVDALIHNGKRGKPFSASKNRPYKSLTDLLKGKQGRFRQNLLGKRVDYSGRSVIVVGPELKMYQCGLPKEMALELFKPFVVAELEKRGLSTGHKISRLMIEREDPQVWDVLEYVIKDHPVLLNRAPTLHRLGIQAFEPILVEGRAIRLHPLVCGAFNADFDGDQMAVHVPLSVEAQAEARVLMLATNNILKLSDGKPVVSPTQDMVLGTYYLTQEREGAKGEGRAFMNKQEALLAYELNQIDLQAKIFVRVQKRVEGENISKRLHTTVGRIIFNSYIPQDLGFTSRVSVEEELDLEIDRVVDKSLLTKIVNKCFKLKDTNTTTKVLDEIKKNGFKYSTLGAITANIFDMTLPEKKKEILDAAEKESLKIESAYSMGRLTEEGRYKEIVEIWTETRKEIVQELEKNVDEHNPIWMMQKSGARGSIDQISQLSGMRGLVRDPAGKIIELPVKASYREGLSVLEYFISSHGGRKGLADTALKTADAGYLTRRLVDAAHSVIIKEHDCGDTRGFIIKDQGGVEKFANKIEGRVANKIICCPKNPDRIIVKKGSLITEEIADEIVRSGITEVEVRSIFNCKTKNGLCSKCYGRNMAGSNLVQVGEAVGVIAAQSIGEPGTQLTMRTFHTGGVAGAADDITSGLPRVEELFEARIPKGAASISKADGQVIEVDDVLHRVVVKESKSDDDEKIREYKDLPKRQKILVKKNQFIKAGDPLTEGPINPQELLLARGPVGVQDYILQEVQKAYNSAGVNVHDKHIEIIIRQMLRNVEIIDQGESDVFIGNLIDIETLDEKNSELLNDGKKPIAAKRRLLGVTRSALRSKSFLSAASFQETEKVLAEAAAKGRIDTLEGLKENVILGKLIPAGTGMTKYRDISIIDEENIRKRQIENTEYVDRDYLKDEGLDSELDSISQLDINFDLGE